MDFKKILFISIFLLAILSIGAVSAAEDVDSDAIAVNDIDADINEDIVQEVDEDTALGAVEEEPVSVADAEIDVTPADGSNMTYKEDKNMAIQLKSGGAVVENPTGNLTVKENENVLFNGPFVNGAVTISLKNLTVANHVFDISYTGPDYSPEDVKYSIDVYPIVNIPPSVTVGEDKYIEMIADPNATGQFVVVIDNDFENKRVTLDPINGTARYSMKNLDDGNVMIQISYQIGGTPLDQYFDVDIASVKGKVVASDVKMYYYDGTKLAVKVYGTNGKLVEYGEEVTIKIGKKTYYAETNSKGVAYLTIKELPGKYSVKISYTDANDKVASITKSLVVQKVLTLKTATVKKSAKKLVLSATLKKGKKAISGKRITFKFNGKTYKATTNKKGIAKVTVKKAVLKKLKVGKKVKYQATYQKCVVKKTAKVKK